MVGQILGRWVLVAAGGAAANKVESLIPEGCSDVGVDLAVGCATDLILSNYVNEAPCDLGHDVISVVRVEGAESAQRRTRSHPNPCQELLPRHFVSGATGLEEGS